MKNSVLRRRRAGFTLAESLIAVAVLAMFALSILSVTTVIFSSKNSMVEVNKCQMLASTVLLTVADEIRYGQNVRKDGEHIVVDSDNFGEHTAFALENGKIKVTNKTDSFDLLTDDYYGSLYVSAFQIASVTADGESYTLNAEYAQRSVKIQITVKGRSGVEYSTELTVAALNGLPNGSH